MDIYEQIKNKKEYISIIGLGYVGIPLVIAFAKKAKTIGFDIDSKKVELLNSGIDVTNEIGSEELSKTTAIISCDEEYLKKAIFHIVTVPTPIYKNNTPNLEPIINASKMVGKYLRCDSIVVYESTVYPGVTEDICIPVLENESGLKCGLDFKVGYSPERINPGDKTHRLESIVKVVSGMDDEALEIIAKVYELIINAGVHKVKSIKEAEAAKVIENAQRDINIAFMNELSIIFNILGVDTIEVLKAARTKWNFIDFKPGLVGGHCIGVDPYYLTHKAEEIGYHSQVILAGRRINDYMGKYIAQNTVKCLIKADVNIKGSTVLVMGITFKENCQDVRNSKVNDIIKELQQYGINVLVTDPIAKKDEVLKEYGISLIDFDEIKDVDAIIVAVKHEQYKMLDIKDLKNKYKDKKPVLVDIKGLFDKMIAQKTEFEYWRL